MERLMELISSNNISELRKTLIEMNVVDIAMFLGQMDKDKALLVFRILPKDISADVFSYLDTEQQQHIIESISDKEVRSIVDDLFLDDTIDFIEEVPANVVKKIIKNTDENTRKLINQFLKYPDYSAGSLMTIEFVDFKTNYTVKTALEDIKKTAVDKETVYTCYVIDEARKLVGTMALRKLLLCEENVLIQDVMDPNVISVNTLDDQETVAEKFKTYDLMSMPVVDNEGRLVGIITIDDIVDVIEEENTEDFEIMAALTPSENEYLKTGVFKLAKNRTIWLLILMVSATFTGKIINGYDHVLQSVLVLAGFIPMLMDTGGNCGSQSATLIIRGMALGEIKNRDIFTVIFKELRVALIVGGALSVVNFLRILVFENVSMQVNITVCISLYATVILSKLAGCILPMAANKLKLDPAIMASPLITTIVDVFSLMIYFNVASWIIGI